MRFRALGAAVGLVGASLLAACGGGSSSSGSSPATTTPAPASGVNPNAGGYIGGPVNKARNTTNQLNEQQKQLEQQTGG